MKATMPFGRHKGVPLNKVPRGYLAWLQEHVALYGWLKDAVYAALTGERLPDEDEQATVHRAVKPWSPSDGEVIVM